MGSTTDRKIREVVIIGGGLAGFSAAIYLGRSRRDTLLVHSGHSMAKWESDVQNYLGFPDGIDGTELLTRAHTQVARFHAEIIEDEVRSLKKDDDTFHLQGQQAEYHTKRVLIATGLTHLPPDIPGVKDCLGKSLFFCKDCDAYRVQAKPIVIIGRNNEAVDYALAMLLFSPSVMIATNGKEPKWDSDHAGWLEEYRILVRQDRISDPPALRWRRRRTRRLKRRTGRGSLSELKNVALGIQPVRQHSPHRPTLYHDSPPGLTPV